MSTHRADARPVEAATTKPEVTVRLFAQAREAAGGSSFVFEAQTIGEVLDLVCDKFGGQFALILESSSVWLNGDEATAATSLNPGDEVAVLPPVSGG